MSSPNNAAAHQSSKNQDSNKEQQENGSTAFTGNSKDFEQLAREAEKERSTRKPGSQSQSGSSGRHNNGRGGGK